MSGRTGVVVQGDLVVVYMTEDEAMDLVLMLPSNDRFTRDVWRAAEELRVRREVVR